MTVKAELFGLSLAKFTKASDCLLECIKSNLNALTRFPLFKHYIDLDENSREDYIWLGLKYNKTEGIFKWSDNAPFFEGIFENFR